MRDLKSLPRQNPHTARTTAATDAVTATATSTPTTMCFGPGVAFERKKNKKNMTVNLPNTFLVSTTLHEEELVSPFTTAV